MRCLPLRCRSLREHSALLVLPPASGAAQPPAAGGASPQGGAGGHAIQENWLQGPQGRAKSHRQGWHWQELLTGTEGAWARGLAISARHPEVTFCPAGSSGLFSYSL